MGFSIFEFGFSIGDSREAKVGRGRLLWRIRGWLAASGEVRNRNSKIVMRKFPHSARSAISGSIRLARSAGREAGEGGDEGEEHGDTRVHQRVERSDVEEQRLDEFRHAAGGGEPEDETERHQPQAAAHDERDHRAARRAERHADADLGSALRHGVGEHRVESDGGEDEGQAGEDGGELRRDALGAETLRERGFDRLEKRNRLVLVHRRDRAADDGLERFGREIGPRDDGHAGAAQLIHRVVDVIGHRGVEPVGSSHRQSRPRSRT